jgi:glycine/D-amino acid oxidase-like deaminating enzyme
VSKLLIIGGGLFGSLAAAHARSQGIEAVVFDAGLPGAASPAAACLLKEAWAGKKHVEAFRQALPLLDRLFGLRQVCLLDDAGNSESFHFVPPAQILERAPLCQRVTAVGDGWLEADGQRHEGWVYVAAGIWCEEFLPGLGVYGKTGAAFAFAGERPGRIRPLAPGRQAMAFVRDSGFTHFSDGSAERDYTAEHTRASLAEAAALGLTDQPVRCVVGRRPYVPGGPVFRRLGERTWLATGGRKLGTILGAHSALRLVEEMKKP